MTDGADTSSLQFTKAEYADAPALTACANCEQAVSDQYFEVNGQTTCAVCTDLLRQAESVKPGIAGIGKAIAAGVGAGILGALLYYAVLALTGYEFGLIAIVVGVFVGRAVRWGSLGRGGRIYQVLAVVLTYLAIVSCYVPFIVQGLRESAAKQAAESQTDAGAATGQSPAEATPPTKLQVAFFLGIVGAVILASPFLAGFENVIGWIIIGIAVWEAWKVNRRAPFEVSGPFTITPPVPPLPPPLPPHTASV
jgi:hypothetical protein